MDRVDRAQRRFPPLGVPIAVVYKFFDDQGNYLAATITYYAFIAIFPLLLLGTSVLNVVLQGNPDLEQQVLDSALAQFPIIGTELGVPGGLTGSTTAVVLGSLAAVYGALGLGQAIQNATNVAWSVPRNRRPNPILLRVKSLLLLMLGGLAVLAITTLSILASHTEVLGESISSYQWPILLGTVVVNTLVFTLFFRVAAARRHSLRSAVAGAFAVAVMWLGLQYAGTWFVQRVLDSTSEMNQTFGLVLGLIGIIFIAAVMGVLGMEVNGRPRAPALAAGAARALQGRRRPHRRGPQGLLQLRAGAAAQDLRADRAHLGPDPHRPGRPARGRPRSRSGPARSRPGSAERHEPVAAVLGDLDPSPSRVTSSIVPRTGITIRPPSPSWSTSSCGSVLRLGRHQDPVVRRAVRQAEHVRRRPGDRWPTAGRSRPGWPRRSPPGRPRSPRPSTSPSGPVRWASSAVVHPEPEPTSSTRCPGRTSSSRSIASTVRGWELVWPRPMSIGPSYPARRRWLPRQEAGAWLCPERLLHGIHAPESNTQTATIPRCGGCWRAQPSASR